MLAFLETDTFFVLVFEPFSGERDREKWCLARSKGLAIIYFLSTLLGVAIFVSLFNGKALICLFFIASFSSDTCRLQTALLTCSMLGDLCLSMLKGLVGVAGSLLD